MDLLGYMLIIAKVIRDMSNGVSIILSDPCPPITTRISKLILPVFGSWNRWSFKFGHKWLVRMAYHRTGAWVPCRIWLRHFKFRIQALPAVHSSIDFVTLLGISAAVSQEKRQRWSLCNVVYDMQERWDGKWYLQSVAKNLNISSPKNYQSLLTQSMRKL